MCFIPPIGFRCVVSVGLAAMNRRNPSFRVRFAHPIWCPDTAADVLTDHGDL